MLEYDEDKHLYTLDGKKISSVTEIAKEFSGLNTEWLNQHPEFAEAGTVIHNELANFFREGTDVELEASKELLEELSKENETKESCHAEILVLNRKRLYAGTCDLVSVEKGKIKSIMDFKTGRHINTKYCTYQLNLYRLALEDMGYDVSEAEMKVIYRGGVKKVKKLSYEDMEEKHAMDELKKKNKKA